MLEVQVQLLESALKTSVSQPLLKSDKTDENLHYERSVALAVRLEASRAREALFASKKLQTIDLSSGRGKSNCMLLAARDLTFI